MAVSCMPKGLLGWTERANLDSFYFQGYINLSTSENKLCLDLITARVSNTLGLVETYLLWAQFPGLFLSVWEVQGENIRQHGES